MTKNLADNVNLLRVLQYSSKYVKCDREHKTRTRIMNSRTLVEKLKNSYCYKHPDEYLQWRLKNWEHLNICAVASSDATLLNFSFFSFPVRCSEANINIYWKYKKARNNTRSDFLLLPLLILKIYDVCQERRNGKFNNEHPLAR